MLFIEKGSKKHRRHYFKNLFSLEQTVQTAIWKMLWFMYILNGNNGVKATMIFLNIPFDPYFNFEKLIHIHASLMYNHTLYVHLCIIKIMFRYMYGSNFRCFEKSQIIFFPLNQC